MGKKSPEARRRQRQRRSERDRAEQRRLEGFYQCKPDIDRILASKPAPAIMRRLDEDVASVEAAYGESFGVRLDTGTFAGVIDTYARPKERIYDVAKRACDGRHVDVLFAGNSVPRSSTFADEGVVEDGRLSVKVKKGPTPEELCEKFGLESLEDSVVTYLGARGEKKVPAPSMLWHLCKPRHPERAKVHGGHQQPPLFHCEEERNWARTANLPNDAIIMDNRYHGGTLGPYDAQDFDEQNALDFIAAGADANATHHKGGDSVSRGESCLTLAAAWSATLVAELIDAGATVNHSTHGGTSALMTAAKHWNAGAVETLLMGKADVNQGNGQGLTPLWLAVSRLIPIKITHTKLAGHG